MKPSPEKLRHVFQLTAAALVVIRRAGKWQKVGSWRLTSAESGGLKIAYRSPFNLKPADLSSAPSYVHEAARRRAAPDLPHKLDIWAPQKVLSVAVGRRGRRQPHIVQAGRVGSGAKC